LNEIEYKPIEGLVMWIAVNSAGLVGLTPHTSTLFAQRMVLFAAASKAQQGGAGPVREPIYHKILKSRVASQDNIIVLPNI
jgi:hypothetical protein